MRVLVDLNFLSAKNLNGGQQYFLDLVSQLVMAIPDNTYIFITNCPELFEARPFTNVQTVRPGRLLDHSLGTWFWYRFKLPKLSSEINGSVLLTMENPFLSKLNLPVAMVLVNPPGASKKRIMLIKRAIGAAAVIIDFMGASEYLVNLPSSKAHPLPVSIRYPPIPLTWDEREQVKQRHTGGREYFLFSADNDASYDLLGLFKAFSAFKKRQHSNMQVVITGRPSLIKAARKLLEHYKYREDIQLLDTPEAGIHAKIIEVAYAFVYPVKEDVFPYSALQAVRLGIPVISYPAPAIDRIFGDHILKASTTDFNDLAQKMQLLYKDEVLRSSMIEEAQAYLTPADGHDIASECLKIIESAAG